MNDRRLHFVIFALFLSVYAYFYNGGGGNQVTRYNLTRAIVNNGTVTVERGGYPSDDQLRINGHSYTSKAPGTSLLGVPPFAILQGVGWVIGLGGAVWVNLLAHLTTIFTVGVPAALAMLALYLLLVGTGVSPPRALLGTMAIGFGTTYFPYATMFFGHSLAGAQSFLSFFLLWQAWGLRQVGKDPGRRVLYAALLIGAAVVTEYPLAITAAVLTLYLLSTGPSRREMLHWALGGGAWVAVLVLYNIIAFGNPLALSYLNYQTSSNNAFPVHSHGLGGVTGPKLWILKEILWGNARGIFWFSPILVLVAPALVFMLIRRRELWREWLVIVTVLIGFLIFNSGYGDSIRYWGGANSAGPRHLIPVFPFVGVAIGYLIGAAPWLFLPLVLISSAVCLAVTAVMPQVPMLYAKPLEQYIFPYFLSGRLSMHRGGMVTAKLITSDSIAYNWAKLWGGHGSWTLAPLFVMLVVLLGWILLELRLKGSLGRLGLVGGLAWTALFGILLVGGPLAYQKATARPLEGPGILGAYYPDPKCSGAPIWMAREPTLSFNYNGNEVRPFPSSFCGLWTGQLEAPDEGVYQFRLSGGQSALWIDHRPVVALMKGGRMQEGQVTLTAGPHLLEVRAFITLISQRFYVQWHPPGGRFEPIPESLLSVEGSSDLAVSATVPEWPWEPEAKSPE